jgi:hypothetical protein
VVEVVLHRSVQKDINVVVFSLNDYIESRIGVRALCSSFKRRQKILICLFEVSERDLPRAIARLTNRWPIFRFDYINPFTVKSTPGNICP